MSSGCNYVMSESTRFWCKESSSQKGYSVHQHVELSQKSILSGQETYLLTRDDLGITYFKKVLKIHLPSSSNIQN